MDVDHTYITELFNLDVIISVGYRVKSKRGTQSPSFFERLVIELMEKMGYGAGKITGRSPYGRCGRKEIHGKSISS